MKGALFAGPEPPLTGQTTTFQQDVRILLMSERNMSRTAKWMTAITVCALSAGVLAAGLVWMVLTRPVVLAEALGRLW